MVLAVEACLELAPDFWDLTGGSRNDPTCPELFAVPVPRRSGNVLLSLSARGWLRSLRRDWKGEWELGKESVVGATLLSCFLLP